MTKKTRRAKARRALLSISLVLVMMMVAVGGTIAWLVDSTETIENTFTVGKVDIDLTETKRGDSGWTAELIPGSTYTKNPVVTVVGGSEECYLFVKVEQPDNITNILEYTLLFKDNDDWTQGTDSDGNGVPANVWFTTVSESLTSTTFHLLKDDSVKVSDNLTNQNMPASNIELNFTAYAVQKENVTTPADAWIKVQNAQEWATGAGDNNAYKDANN